jgi:3alpha(or 20beta)-hydroxysteroid dehydrogenase
MATALLEGKIALITGAGNGIGAACARRMASEGASVVVTDIAEQDCAAVARTIEGAMATKLDISSEGEWRLAIQASLERFGGLDILVNNGAIYDRQSLGGTDAATMERFFRVNQLGPFLGMRAVTEIMKKRGGGSIINIASVAALNGYPDIFAYGVSKWAVRGMTRYAARDLGAYNIRVNAILPGVIETRMIGGVDRAIVDTWLATIPLKRLGLPDEIASVAVFLGSNLAAYMSGSDVVVDAGQVA